MTEKTSKPFACHGSEKMIYDIRMGPQAVCYNDVIYIAYQANPDGPEAHPHIITYDLGSEKWSYQFECTCKELYEQFRSYKLDTNYGSPATGLDTSYGICVCI